MSRIAGHFAAAAALTALLAGTALAQEGEATPPADPPADAPTEAVEAPASAAPAAKGPTDVVVETSRQQYVAGDVVEIIVTNKRTAPIFLAGCGSFTVQLFDRESYTSLPTEQCVSEGEALEVAPGTYTLSWQAIGARGGEILRIGLAYGHGCETGRALTQARCTDFATVYSAPFRVGKKVDKGN